MERRVTGNCHARCEPGESGENCKTSSDRYLSVLSAKLTNPQRKAVYRRDSWRCALCDSTKYLQIHHIIKRSQGGSNHPHNLITLCSDCHALAHGIDLRSMPDMGAGTWNQTQWDPEVESLLDIEKDRPIDQAIVEYMADLYACEGVQWCPWLKEKGRR